MLMALSNIKINSTKELKNVIKHARPLLGQVRLFVHNHNYY